MAAFTAAWERPNEFHKVLSWIGRFTNLASGPTVRAGGHDFEAMIRKTPKKPIRIFMQDGANDLDNKNGNWPLANQTLAKSLVFKITVTALCMATASIATGTGDSAGFVALVMAGLRAVSFQYLD